MLLLWKIQGLPAVTLLMDSGKQEDLPIPGDNHDAVIGVSKLFDVPIYW